MIPYNHTVTHTFRASAFYWVFRLIWWNSDPGSIPLSTHPLLTSKQLNTAGEKSHIMLTKFKLKIYNLQPQINPQDCFQFSIFLWWFYSPTSWGYCFASFPLRTTLTPHCSRLVIIFLRREVIKGELWHFPITLPSATFWLCDHWISLYSVMMPCSPPIPPPFLPIQELQSHNYPIVLCTIKISPLCPSLTHSQ